MKVGTQWSTLVDVDLFAKLNQYEWYRRKSFHKFYVVRYERKGGKLKIIRLHRHIAKTPYDLQCHHINGNSFDNRRANLMNVTDFEHRKMFSYR